MSIKNNAELMDWQRRFREAPAVWCLIVDDDELGEAVSSIYDSEEAAKVAFDWWTARGKARKRRIEKWNVHTLELARERWS